MLDKLLQNGLQDWIDDLNIVVSFQNKKLAEEIIGAILKTCQDYGVNKESIYKMIDYDGLKAVVRNIIKIQYSKNYKKITI